MNAAARVAESAVRCVDVAVGTLTLRVSRTADAEGSDVVTLALGYGGRGEPFRRPQWLGGGPISAPVECAPEIVDALRALEVL